MKKSNILIAAFAAIIAAAPFAAAEDFGVDFDRGAFRTADFMEAIAQNEKTLPILPEVFPAEAINKANSSKMYKLDKVGRQMLYREIIDKPIKSFSQDVLELINNEKVAIFYNDEVVCFTNKIETGTYNILQKNYNKLLLTSLMKLKEQSSRQEMFSQNKNWIKICKEVIDWVIRIKGGVEVLVEVKTWVCEQEWVDSTPGSGGIAPIPGGSSIPGIHHERSGNLNYDINKRLK